MSVPPPSVARMSNDDLSAASVGTVIRPGDPEWESARRFHSGIGSPAAVIRASSVDDVRGAIRYASAERLEVMIRGGGHSAWGEVPGGLTLDISALDAISVEGTRVRVGVPSRTRSPSTTSDSAPATPRPSASAGSPSGAASAGWCARGGSRATSWWARSS
jgi:hypothetical protein